MTGMQMQLKEWQGQGAGLSYVQLLSDGRSRSGYRHTRCPSLTSQVRMARQLLKAIEVYAQAGAIGHPSRLLVNGLHPPHRPASQQPWLTTVLQRYRQIAASDHN